jgi:hypothetical protein
VPERKRLNDRVALPTEAAAPTGEMFRMFKERHDPRTRSVKWHHYFAAYEHHLNRFRKRPVTVLEIGVKAGGSLSVLSEYLGPLSTVVGIDILSACARFDGIAPNIHVRVGDQADTTFLAEVEREFGPFDVIIDDGGHTARQQITSFNFLYPEMTADGVYLCEDTHTSYFEAFQDAGPGVSMMKNSIALLHELHAIYGSHDLLNQRFNVPPEQRQGHITTSRFAAETRSIHFYDSIIVFERQPRVEPYFEFN